MLLVQYLQLFSVLFYFGEKWNLPYQFLNPLSWMVVFNLDFPMLIPTTYTFIAYAILLGALFVLVLLLPFVIRICQADVTQIRRCEFFVFWAVDILYFPAMWAGARFVLCQNGKAVAQSSLECSSAPHWVLIAVAYGVLLVIGVGYPAILFLTIHRQIVYRTNETHLRYMEQREAEYIFFLNDTWWNLRFFLFSSFKRAHVYFRPTSMLMRFVFAVVVCVSYSVPAMQAWIAFGVILLWNLYCMLRPFRCTSSNLALLALGWGLQLPYVFAPLAAIKMRSALLVSSVLAVWMMVVLALPVALYLLVFITSCCVQHKWPVTAAKLDPVVRDCPHFLYALRHSRVLLERNQDRIPELFEARQVRTQIQVLHGYWYEASRKGVFLEYTLREVLNDLISMAKMKHCMYPLLGAMNEESILDLADRLEKRRHYLALVRPAKRRCLFKLYAISAFLNGRVLARFPEKEREWYPQPPGAEADEEPDDDLIDNTETFLSLINQRLGIQGTHPPELHDLRMSLADDEDEDEDEDADGSRIDALMRVLGESDGLGEPDVSMSMEDLGDAIPPHLRRLLKAQRRSLRPDSALSVASYASSLPDEDYEEQLASAGVELDPEGLDDDDEGLFAEIENLTQGAGRPTGHIGARRMRSAKPSTPHTPPQGKEPLLSGRPQDESVRSSRSLRRSRAGLPEDVEGLAQIRSQLAARRILASRSGHRRSRTGIPEVLATLKHHARASTLASPRVAQLLAASEAAARRQAAANLRRQQNGPSLRTSQTASQDSPRASSRPGTARGDEPIPPRSARPGYQRARPESLAETALVQLAAQTGRKSPGGPGGPASPSLEMTDDASSSDTRANSSRGAAFTAVGEDSVAPLRQSSRHGNRRRQRPSRVSDSYGTETSPALLEAVFAPESSTVDKSQHGLPRLTLGPEESDDDGHAAPIGTDQTTHEPGARPLSPPALVDGSGVAPDKILTPSARRSSARTLSPSPQWPLPVPRDPPALPQSDRPLAAHASSTHSLGSRTPSPVRTSQGGSSWSLPDLPALMAEPPELPPPLVPAYDPPPPDPEPAPSTPELKPTPLVPPLGTPPLDLEEHSRRFLSRSARPGGRHSVCVDPVADARRSRDEDDLERLRASHEEASSEMDGPATVHVPRMRRSRDSFASAPPSEREDIESLRSSLKHLPPSGGLLRHSMSAWGTEEEDQGEIAHHSLPPLEESVPATTVPATPPTRTSETTPFPPTTPPPAHARPRPLRTPVDSDDADQAPQPPTPSSALGTMQSMLTTDDADQAPQPPTVPPPSTLRDNPSPSDGVTPADLQILTRQAREAQRALRDLEQQFAEENGRQPSKEDKRSIPGYKAAFLRVRNLRDEVKQRKAHQPATAPSPDKARNERADTGDPAGDSAPAPAPKSDPAQQDLRSLDTQKLGEEKHNLVRSLRALENEFIESNGHKPTNEDKRRLPGYVDLFRRYKRINAELAERNTQSQSE